MKYLFFLQLLVLMNACTLNGGRGTHFQSYGNIYTVDLIGFNSNEVEGIKKQLHNKTFNIKTEEIIWESRGHTFKIEEDFTNWKYHFKIRKKAGSARSLDINIQGFINENGKLRRLVNPGDFNTYKYSSHHKDKFNALRFLLIQLSYK